MTTRDKRQRVDRPRYTEAVLRKALIEPSAQHLPVEQLGAHGGQLLLCAMAVSGHPIDRVRQLHAAHVEQRSGKRGGSENLDALDDGTAVWWEPERVARDVVARLTAEHTGGLWLWRGKRLGWRTDEALTQKAYCPWTGLGRLATIAGLWPRRGEFAPTVNRLLDDLKYERAIRSLVAVPSQVRNLRGRVIREEIGCPSAGLRSFAGDLYSQVAMALMRPLWVGQSTGDLLSDLILELVQRTGVATGTMTMEAAARVLRDVPVQVPITVERYVDGAVLTHVGDGEHPIEVGGSSAALGGVYTGPPPFIWTLKPRDVDRILGERVQLLTGPAGAWVAYPHRNNRERGVSATYHVERRSVARWLVGESRAGRVEVKLRPESEIAEWALLGPTGTTYERLRAAA